MDTEKQENTELKAMPTEAQLELAAAEQKEKEECWNAVMEILKKYNYNFIPSMSISANRGVGFIIDIEKKKA